MSEKQKRTEHIDTRLTADEFNKISEKAKNVGLTKSEYLRNLGMNYPLKSIIDQQALSELIKTKADLGRLGGLFKLWLADNTVDKFDFSDKRTYKNIDDLVDEIELLTKDINQYALQIIKNIK